MKKIEIILEAAKKDVHDSGNQSWSSIAKVGIGMAQKDMFDYLYDEAELEENKNLSLSDFFNKMDRKLMFELP